jgi:hypothetical protein
MNSATFVPAPQALSTLDRYLFDTLGFVVVKGVFNKEELALINKGIDCRERNDFHERTGTIRNSSLGKSGRRDCGNFLAWPESDGGSLLRSLLNHQRLHPLLNELCGEGHRLDHKPVMFIQEQGAEGFDLHGGSITASGAYNFPISYHFHGQQIVCSLINVAVQLTDSPKGSGGFVVVPGSHKSNFPPPGNREALQHIADRYGYQPECEAGDAVLFTEAVLHGAAVRKSPEQRRVVLMRFSPATCAYARGYANGGFDDFIPILTPPQQAVAGQLPFHLDQDRETPAGNVTVSIPHARRKDKKEFDRVVFGNEYY